MLSIFCLVSIVLGILLPLVIPMRAMPVFTHAAAAGFILVAPSLAATFMLKDYTQ